MKSPGNFRYMKANDELTDLQQSKGSMDRMQGVHELEGEKNTLLLLVTKDGNLARPSVMNVGKIPQ